MKKSSRKNRIAGMTPIPNIPRHTSLTTTHRRNSPCTDPLCDHESSIAFE